MADWRPSDTGLTLGPEWTIKVTRHAAERFCTRILQQDPTNSNLAIAVAYIRNLLGWRWLRPVPARSTSRSILVVDSGGVRFVLAKKRIVLTVYAAPRQPVPTVRYRIRAESLPPATSPDLAKAYVALLQEGGRIKAVRRGGRELCLEAPTGNRFWYDVLCGRVHPAPGREANATKGPRPEAAAAISVATRQEQPARPPAVEPPAGKQRARWMIKGPGLLLDPGTGLTHPTETFLANVKAGADGEGFLHEWVNRRGCLLQVLEKRWVIRTDSYLGWVGPGLRLQVLPLEVVRTEPLQYHLSLKLLAEELPGWWFDPSVRVSVSGLAKGPAEQAAQRGAPILLSDGADLYVLGGIYVFVYTEGALRQWGLLSKIEPTLRGLCTLPELAHWWQRNPGWGMPPRFEEMYVAAGCPERAGDWYRFLREHGVSQTDFWFWYDGGWPRLVQLRKKCLRNKNSSCGSGPVTPAPE